MLAFFGLFVTLSFAPFRQLFVGFTEGSESEIKEPRNGFSITVIEMSRTARNLPQLFKCSFSKRMKFHRKRLREKK